MRPAVHRVVLAVILLGNAVVFAGVDAPLRLATAILVLVLCLDLPAVPSVPRWLQCAAWLFLALAVVQLVPLPLAFRELVQPGFVGLQPPGWYPLSLAPWATLRFLAAAVVATGIALTSARMAATRSGLPLLLGVLAAVGGVLAVLGLAGEGGAPEKVLLLRANTGGGDAYGPYVNSNHFAVGIELTVPAVLALLAVSLRNLSRPGAVRQRAAVTALAAAVVGAVSVASVLRSGSRGGVLFLAAGLVITSPWWWSSRGRFHWRWLAPVAAIIVGAIVLASTRLLELREGLMALLVLEGAEGNTRWDIWAATWELFTRSPVVGSGLGSYRHVIGIDKPATGAAVLEQAHNGWLEWLATSGVVGAAVLLLVVAGMGWGLRPGRVRRFRFELRYPLAGAAIAMTAVGLHELVGFGLHTPINRYLLAVWVGMVLGVANRPPVRGPRVGPGEAEELSSGAGTE
jgi:O-antigen ligase